MKLATSYKNCLHLTLNSTVFCVLTQEVRYHRLLSNQYKTVYHKPRGDDDRNITMFSFPFLQSYLLTW